MTGFFHLTKRIFSKFIYIVAYVSFLFIVEYHCIGFLW